MKINRYKKVHKILKFYSNNFGFRKPYQVLIDGTICVTALKHKINIQDQFSKYLEGEAKLLTTQCILKEVEQLGPATFGALVVIKQFGVHQCGHAMAPVQASECILDMVGEGNASRYVIATQDRELQQRCRSIRGVPLLYLHSRTPVLEAPSPFSREAASERTRERWAVSQWEKEKLGRLREGEGEEGEESAVRRRKRKGGPNPLSCKKKKKKVEQCVRSRKCDLAESKKKRKKRKRNRSRLVKKIKNEVLANLNS